MNSFCLFSDALLRFISVSALNAINMAIALLLFYVLLTNFIEVFSTTNFLSFVLLRRSNLKMMTEETENVDYFAIGSMMHPVSIANRGITPISSEPAKLLDH